MSAYAMSCRTGPLRAGRAFARLFNLSWQGGVLGVLPLVGLEPSNARTVADDLAGAGIHATKWPLAAQAARPAGHAKMRGYWVIG
jgi:hypothetical protein